MAWSSDGSSAGNLRPSNHRVALWLVGTVRHAVGVAGSKAVGCPFAAILVECSPALRSGYVQSATDVSDSASLGEVSLNPRDMTKMLSSDTQKTKMQVPE